MNESPAGRDGYILAMGRRIYHVYKQTFPMQFIYGLTAEANREDSPGLIDVRTLPEKYQLEAATVAWTTVPKRSFAKRLREQLNAHAMIFASALADGYDLEAHAQREKERAEQEWREYRQRQAAQQAEWAAQGVCTDCGDPNCPDKDFCVPF